ncbi:conserved phage C-terminal domain-containing protein [Psychrobacillus sp. FSL K6-1464]|uniref:conserved phage C-terminal domain-containing protein n=1 Tax=Psychrobacillus sp. FSL K6-1464 TaxID=2921545 RepID=UPI0030FA1FD7
MASQYDEVRRVLAQLSGHDRIVTIPKLYIEMTGDLAESVLLNQIVFYSDKSKRNDGYFYKTYEDWSKEVCLTERQVRYSAKKLIEKGLIETKVLKANGSPTVHYKLCFDNLVSWIVTNCKDGNLQSVTNDTDNLSESLTEITTEITTDHKEILSDKPDDIPYSKIIEYLNIKANTNFKASSQATQSKIKARWNEGHRLDVFLHVIDVKVSEWLDSQKWNQYLRPSTLFGTNFENYRNQKKVVNKNAANQQRGEEFRRQNDLPF